MSGSRYFFITWRTKFAVLGNRLHRGCLEYHFVVTNGSLYQLHTTTNLALSSAEFFDLRDYRRLKRIYHLAYEARVPVYVLTDREQIANLIVTFIGDRRVNPLPQRFERMSFLSEMADESIFGMRDPGILIATGIIWEGEEWTRAKQHEYVLQAFSDRATPEHVLQDGFFNFLVERKNTGDKQGKQIPRWYGEGQ